MSKTERTQIDLNFRILETLGQGGMGEIYKAQDIRLNRIVAIKVLLAHQFEDEEAHLRFKREAQAGARLEHDNIVTTHDFGIYDGRPYLVMGFIEGETLHQRLQRVERLAVEDTVRLIAPIARALAYAHGKNVIHRDITSNNIMIRASDERPILIDFGIAQATFDQRLTGPGESLGTITYMSPEQAKAQEIDYRSDLYSLGVVLYECLTGKLPFQSSNNMVLLSNIKHEPHTPVRDRRPDIPEWLAKVVDRCLAKDPADRFLHGHALADALERGVPPSRGDATVTMVAMPPPIPSTPPLIPETPPIVQEEPAPAAQTPPPIPEAQPSAQEEAALPIATAQPPPLPPEASTLSGLQHEPPPIPETPPSTTSSKPPPLPPAAASPPEDKPVPSEPSESSKRPLETSKSVPVPAREPVPAPTKERARQPAKLWMMRLLMLGVIAVGSGVYGYFNGWFASLLPIASSSAVSEPPDSLAAVDPISLDDGTTFPSGDTTGSLPTAELSPALPEDTSATTTTPPQTEPQDDSPITSSPDPEQTETTSLPEKPEDTPAAELQLEDTPAPERPTASERAAEGVTFYKARQYAQALPILRNTASEGVAEAQFYLGEMHAHGRGVRKSESQAEALYLQAARQGHTQAQYTLAHHFRDRGRSDKALPWYVAAAEGGHAEAQYQAGFTFMKQGDDPKAVHWWKKAAAQGHDKAKKALARRASRKQRP